MEIRNLRDEEKMESMRLSEFAFQYELQPEQREERLAKMRVEQVWGCFSEGKLASKLHIFDLAVWVHGKEFKMGGIAGVASWPEYRRKGQVGKLILNALSVMKEKGQTLSFLAPFSIPFYYKYGWETLTDIKKYEIDVDKLPKYDVAPGSIIRDAHDVSLLNGIYEQFAPRYSGMLIRTEEWWNAFPLIKNKKGQAAVYRNASNEPQGYVLYEIKEHKCTIQELVALNEEARRAIWRFIADHDSMMDKVDTRAPMDDIMPFMLSNPRIKQEIEPYFMARIVDVEPFLNAYPWEISNIPTTIRIAVRDNQAQWNNGVFEINHNGNGVSVRSLDASDSITENVLSCDIQTLTAMLLGYQRPITMHAIGRLQGELSRVNELEQLLPSNKTCLYDYF